MSQMTVKVVSTCKTEGITTVTKEHYGSLEAYMTKQREIARMNRLAATGIDIDFGILKTATADRITLHDALERHLAEQKRLTVYNGTTNTKGQDMTKPPTDADTFQMLPGAAPKLELGVFAHKPNVRIGDIGLDRSRGCKTKKNYPAFWPKMFVPGALVLVSKDKQRFWVRLTADIDTHRLCFGEVKSRTGIKGFDKGNVIKVAFFNAIRLVPKETLELE